MSSVRVGDWCESSVLEKVAARRAFMQRCATYVEELISTWRKILDSRKRKDQDRLLADAEQKLLRRAAKEGLPTTLGSLKEGRDGTSLPAQLRWTEKPIRGVFCDVDGTLLSGNSLNFALVQHLRGREADGLPVFIWTGGSREDAEKRLRQLGLDWLVYSKERDFLGATVEEAIDDLLHELGRYQISFLRGSHPSKLVK